MIGPRVDGDDTSPAARFMRELMDIPVVRSCLIQGSATAAGTVSIRHPLEQAYRGAIVCGVVAGAIVSVQPISPSAALSAATHVDVRVSAACAFTLLVF